MSSSYLKDRDGLESSLPAINGGVRQSRSRLIDIDDHHHHHHHTTGGHHHHHHHNHDGSPKHVRFSSHLSGSTSSLNREFTSSATTASPGCQARKQVLELQDQVRIYREELAKKDDLIKKLTDANSSQSRHVDFNYSKLEEAFSTERSQSLAAARSEVAALQVKCDGLTAQMYEVKNQLESRENKIRDLTHEVESVRESEAKHVAIAQSLREKIMEYEQSAGSLEGVAERNEIVISSLKREKEECNNKILDLESRLRKYWEEKESMALHMSSFESKYKDVISNFSSLFGITEIHFGDSPSDIIGRVKDLYVDNSSLREKINSLTEYVRTAELESKASRETIHRLVTESEEKQSITSKYTLDIERYKQDAGFAEAKKREVEHELISLRERLEASQNAWAVTRRELEEKESKYAHYSKEVQDHELLARGQREQFRSFRESLANLLSEECCCMEASEDTIIERIRALLANLRDKTAHVTVLESQITTVSQNMERHNELQRSADSRAKRVEADYFEIESKLRQYESELASERIMRDGFRADKEKYMKFLETCCHVLRLDIIASDVGMEMVIDAIIRRCEQVQKMEVDAVNEKQTLVYNIQRKNKALKEQLESRDLHIDLLRKKVAGLEERLAGKSDLEKEKDNEALKSKKLMKLIEKYKKELQEAHVEMQDMKAKLMEGTEFRNRTLEAEGHIDCLESKMGQLEGVRMKQAEKISHLQSTLSSKSDDLNSNLSTANHTIQALTRELKTTKTGLDESSKREKQLLDLRQVISRMLGLDVNLLAVPDYEIISRLEKLILAHQSSAATAVAVDGAIVDMEDGFREGYNQPGRVFVRARSPAKRTTTTTRVRTRTRSLSPGRRKDNRSY